MCSIDYKFSTLISRLSDTVKDRLQILDDDDTMDDVKDRIQILGEFILWTFNERVQE